MSIGVEQVSIGAQHVLNTLTRYLPMKISFFQDARIDRRCVELHQIPGSTFGIVFTPDGDCHLPVSNKVLTVHFPLVWTQLE